MTSSPHDRNANARNARWTFCSRDGFVYVELEPPKPSLYQRYFDWRDSVSNNPANIPASCRWEVEHTRRRAEWIEMQEMSSSSTFRGREDVQPDVDEVSDEGFDDCKIREPEERRRPEKESLWRSVKQAMQVVDRIIAVKRS